ncbi:MAG: PAS domain S-box protein, partial [Burkholderiaceae bacterium]|nr:PAS domain S-box protein [Burkholderiaceae bacterium]
MTKATLALSESSRPTRKTGPLRCQCTLVLALALLFALVWLMPPRHLFEGVANYAWLHMALETPSLLVAGMVFGVAWNAYASERPGNFMLLAIGLFATAAIDFAHVLSFKGMPDFVTPSDPEKAINFWLAARLCFALTLTAVALRPWSPFRRPGTRHLLLGAALALAALVLWFGLTRQDALPHTFIAGRGLTPFKVGAEYLIIAILAVPALIFLRRADRPREYDAPSLFAAAAISILSELCFTLYSDVTDIFNLLGHVYKVIAFGMIYRAVFIGSVRAPFERALAAQAEMRAASFYVRSLIEASVDPLFMVNPEGRITDVNQAAADVTGRRREQLVGADFGACFTEPEQARASFQTMLSENLVRDQLLTVRDAAGGLTEVLFNATVYRNALGQVEGIVAAARDFTEIRRAQQTLVRQHALLSKITETGPIGIVVCDLGGRVTFANAEADKLLAGPHGTRAQLSGAASAAITDFA